MHLKPCLLHNRWFSVQCFVCLFVIVLFVFLSLYCLSFCHSSFCHCIVCLSVIVLFVFLSFIVCLSVIFLFVIVLFVPLRFKASDQPFGSFDCLVFNATFSYIMTTSFSGGRSWSTRREPPTMGKQLVNVITCGCESSASFL